MSRMAPLVSEALRIYFDAMGWPMYWRWCVRLEVHTMAMGLPLKRWAQIVHRAVPVETTRAPYVALLCQSGISPGAGGRHKRLL